MMEYYMYYWVLLPANHNSAALQCENVYSEAGV